VVLVPVLVALALLEAVLPALDLAPALAPTTKGL